MLWQLLALFSPCQVLQSSLSRLIFQYQSFVVVSSADKQSQLFKLPPLGTIYTSTSGTMTPLDNTPENPLCCMKIFTPFSPLAGFPL